MSKQARATALLSVLIYAIVIGTTFDPKCREVFVKAFGESPPSFQFCSQFY